MTRNLLEEQTKRLVQHVDGSGGLAKLFAYWFGLKSFEQPSYESGIEGIWHYQDVACAALVEILGGQTPRPFSAGLAALMRREYFSKHRSPGFEADPLAILAVSLGIRREPNWQKEREWIRNIARTALSNECDKWRAGLLCAALNAVEITKLPSVYNVIDIAMDTKGITNETPRDLDEAANDCLAVDISSSEQAIFRLTSLQSLVRQSGQLKLGNLSISDVVNLLKRAEASLRRWPWEDRPRTSGQDAQAIRWNVANEYHVQAFLWALLRPVFPDLRDEEYLKGIGYKHPRVDLAIPSLRLIVEVKFLRTGTQSALAKVIEEIAADASLYLSQDNGFDQIIAFIWDDAGLVQHHEALTSGLEQLKGINTALVISRPGNWTL